MLIVASASSAPGGTCTSEPSLPCTTPPSDPIVTGPDWAASTRTGTVNFRRAVDNGHRCEALPQRRDKAIGTDFDDAGNADVVSRARRGGCKVRLVLLDTDLQLPNPALLGQRQRRGIDVQSKYEQQHLLDVHREPQP